MPDRLALELLGPSAGGIRRHVAALAERLPEHGWAAETAGPGGVLDGLAELHHHVRVPGPGPALLGAVRALRKAVDRSDAEVIHAHGLKAGWLAALARTGVPVVVTVHNVVLDEAAGPQAVLLRRLEAALPSRAAATIAVSGDIAAHLRPTGAAIDVVRPVGPEPRPRRSPAEVRAGIGVPGGVPLVVALARLHPQKDLPTLLRAIAQVRSSHPEVHLAVFGEGPEEQRVRALVAELGLGEVVHLHAPTDDAAGALVAADVVAVSSIWEGSPLVVAEALELGRPVVATAVGAIPDLVLDGKTGRLVEPSDPGALAAGIRSLLDDREAAAEMGEAGRQRVLERLDRDRLVAEVAAVYERVLR